MGGVERTLLCVYVHNTPMCTYVFASGHGCRQPETFGNRLARRQQLRGGAGAGAYPGCLHHDDTGSILDHVLRRLEREVRRWALIVDDNHIVVPGESVQQYATGQFLAASAGYSSRHTGGLFACGLNQNGSTAVAQAAWTQIPCPFYSMKMVHRPQTKGRGGETLMRGDSFE